MENIKYNSKDKIEQKLYQKNKYIKYNSNIYLQYWLKNQPDYKCLICNKNMTYNSKYRHLASKSHRNIEELSEIKKIDNTN